LLIALHLNSNGQPFCCKLFQLSKVTFNVQGPNNYKSTIKCPFFLKDLNFLCAKFDAHGNSESMQTTYRIRKSYYYHRYYQKYADFDIFFVPSFAEHLSPEMLIAIAVVVGVVVTILIISIFILYAVRAEMCCCRMDPSGKQKPSDIER